MCQFIGLEAGLAQDVSSGEQPQAAVDQVNKICPVSGDKIDEKNKASYVYGGKIYNFCCPACIEEFKKDPQKYIKKVEDELKTKDNSGNETPADNQKKQ